jgi:hypothetical protein
MTGIRKRVLKVIGIVIGIIGVPLIFNFVLYISPELIKPPFQWLIPIFNSFAGYFLCISLFLTYWGIRKVVTFIRNYILYGLISHIDIKYYFSCQEALAQEDIKKLEDIKKERNTYLKYWR